MPSGPSVFESGIEADDRLSSTEHRQRFILKGATLMTIRVIYTTRRAALDLPAARRCRSGSKHRRVS